MIEKVNKIIDKISTNTITETNDLVYAVSSYAAKKLGIKTCKRRPRKEPWWKRRLNEDIKCLRRELNILERERKEQVKNRSKLEQLEKKYQVKSKKLNTVIEEIKQRLVAKAAKVKRYEQRGEQFKQIQLFDQDQKSFTNSSTAALDKKALSLTWKKVKTIG